MAEEPDKLLREMRGEMSRIERTLQEVRLTVAGHDSRFDAFDEKVDLIREGTVSAIGFAANTSRAHGDLKRRIEALTRRVDRPEAAK